MRTCLIGNLLPSVLAACGGRAGRWWRADL